MSGGLTIKKGKIALVGGLTTQPVKKGVVNAKIKTATPVHFMSSKGNIKTTKAPNVVKVQVTNTRRAKIVAERGINEFRPEIVAGLDFMPAYSNGNNLTPVGEMLDVQACARNIRIDNINAFIEELRDDPELSRQLQILEDEFRDNLEQARADVRFMFDAYAAIDDVLRRFDVVRHIDDLAQIAARIANIKRVFSIEELFVDHMNFDRSSVTNFTVTKILTQLLYDLGSATRRYTLGVFGLRDADRTNDDDPYVIDRTITLTNGKFTFDIGRFSGRGRNVNAFDTSTFNRFVDSLPSSRDDRMKLMALTLSRILSVSSALGTRIVQADLRRLGVDVDDDDPIAALVGIPGQTIFDEPAVDNTLVGALRIVEGNDVILPFERRYIVDNMGRRYIPGNDYFFDGFVSKEDDFDVTRIVDFNARFKERITRGMNVIEAATRIDTPLVKKLYGDNVKALQATNIYQRALKIASDVAGLTFGGDERARNNLFIFALFELAQSNRRVRHLLFQLLFLAVLYDGFKNISSPNVEIVDDLKRNEVRRYGDLPALAGYVTDIAISTGEAGVFSSATVDIGATLTNGAVVDLGGKTLSPNAIVGVIEAAYRQVQRDIFDIVFVETQGNAGGGQITTLSENDKSPAQAHIGLKSFTTQLTTTTFGASSTKTIKFKKPDFLQTFDDDFRAVLMRIARFIDDLEDVASLGAAAVDNAQKRAHVLPNTSGKSRYLHINASVRMLLGFELAMSALGGFNVAKFSGADTSNDAVYIAYDKTRIKSLRDAVSSMTSTKFIAPTKDTKQAKIVSAITQAPQKKDAALSLSNALKGNSDANVVSDFINEFNAVTNTLRRDMEVVRSMTSNVRAISEFLDVAIDKVRAFFASSRDMATKQFAAFVVSDVARRATNTRTQFVANVLPKATTYTKQYVISRDVKRRIDQREKSARRVLLSRQQASLALVKLNDVLQHNLDVNSSRIRTVQLALGGDAGVKRANRVFVDDDYIAPGVINALWSMLADARFKGEQGESSKILSIGIPAGLTERLEDSDVLREGGDVDRILNRQSDIVVVNVYMRDMLNEDIIFAPQRYIFEMSRFVSSFSFAGSRASTNPNAPMRFHDVVMNITKMLDTSALNVDESLYQLGKEFVDDSRYDFLTRRQKLALVENHVISYILSVYVRLLTGIDLREDSFLVEPDAVSLQDDPRTSQAYEKMMRRIVEKSSLDITLDELRGKFSEFDALLTAIEEGELQPGVLETALIYDRVGLKKKSALVSDDIVDLARLGGSKSILTGGERLRRAITTPKFFERVFNVVVDPFDFEIDIDATNKTRAGRLAIRRLKAADELSTSFDSITGDERITLKRRSPNNAMSFAQYFVTISRFKPGTHEKRQHGGIIGRRIKSVQLAMQQTGATFNTGG